MAFYDDDDKNDKYEHFYDVNNNQKKSANKPDGFTNTYFSDNNSQNSENIRTNKSDSIQQEYQNNRMSYDKPKKFYDNITEDDRSYSSQNNRMSDDKSKKFYDDISEDNNSVSNQNNTFSYHKTKKFYDDNYLSNNSYLNQNNFNDKPKKFYDDFPKDNNSYSNKSSHTSNSKDGFGQYMNDNNNNDENGENSSNNDIILMMAEQQRKRNKNRKIFGVVIVTIAFISIAISFANHGFRFIDVKKNRRPFSNRSSYKTRSYRSNNYSNNYNNKSEIEKEKDENGYWEYENGKWVRKS